jgi:hypothetical protein
VFCIAIPLTQAAADFGAPVGEDLGYATPGHAEEHDYMTAFFDNQDHDAFADTVDNAGHHTNPQIEKHLADFFGFSETTTQGGDTQPDTVLEGYPWAGDSPVMNQRVPSDMANYVANYFNRQYPSTVQETPETWAENGVDQQGVSSPADVADYVANYFNTQQQQSTVEETPETGYGNPVLAATVEDGGYPVLAKMESNSNDNDGKDVVGEDGVNNYFGDWSDSVQRETTSQNLPSDDLELWFQAMREHNDDGEEVEEDMEEDVDTSKLNVNFMDDYPEELFSEAMLQAMMQMDPECLEWKEKIERGYRSMREHGMRLQKRLAAYQKAMDDYKARKAVPCKKDCAMKCIPMRVGEECTDMVNGTCRSRVPKIVDCGRKQRDPGCEAEEARCRSQIQPLVEELQRTKREVDRTKEELDTEARKREMEMEKFPQRCQESVGDGIAEEDDVDKRA